MKRAKRVPAAPKPGIDIADLKRVSVGPTDILVVKIDGHLSDGAMKRAKSIFHAALPSLKGRILLIDALVTLAVIDRSRAVP